MLLGRHNVFLTQLLRLINTLLEGQVVTELHLIGLWFNNEAEYRVDEIRDQKQGRGGADLYLVKWTGYKTPT